MGVRTASEFAAGLRDGREVYYHGRRVTNLASHRQLGVAFRHAAIDFGVGHNPRHRPLAVEERGEGAPYSAFYRVPRSSEHLLRRSKLIELCTELGGTLVTLIKEIGTDATFALMRVLAADGNQQGLDRLDEFYRECRDGDLALAVAQTDVKGDRSLRPGQQDDPDLYLRIVDRDGLGITVRGAKAHTSCAAYVDRLIVLPSRSMASSEADWSFAFWLPLATPGLRLYASDFLDGASDSFRHPVSSRHRMIETLTVFDDVRIPWSQVFFVDRPDLASASALAFVEFHRFTAVSYKLPLLDALVGAAILAAEANGIGLAPHVRDKITWLSGYAETVRALVEMAALRGRLEQGIALPDPFTTNLAKWTFARDLHQALQMVQDIAGGLVVTGPSGADWKSDQVRPALEKYLKGALPAVDRLAILNLVGDLTTGTFGGYQSVLAIHAEGSIEAEKIAMHRSYVSDRAVGLARRLAGLSQ